MLLEFSFQLKLRIKFIETMWEVNTFAVLAVHSPEENSTWNDYFGQKVEVSTKSLQFFYCGLFLLNELLKQTDRKLLFILWDSQGEVTTVQQHSEENGELGCKNRLVMLYGNTNFITKCYELVNHVVANTQKQGNEEKII